MVRAGSGREPLHFRRGHEDDRGHSPSAPPQSGRRIEFPVIKGQTGGGVLTQEMVAHAEEQMLKEEAEYYGKFMRC